MEPIDGIAAMPPDRWELRCSCCKQTMGAKIQCKVNSCYTAFHPLW